MLRRIIQKEDDIIKVAEDKASRAHTIIMVQMTQTIGRFM